MYKAPELGCVVLEGSASQTESVGASLVADFPTTFESIALVVLDFVGFIQNYIVPAMPAWWKERFERPCIAS